MFDVGFFELLLIGIVGLVVIGPDRLPGVTRKAGLWIGKARRMVGDVKADIEQELKAEELNKMLTTQKERVDQSVHQIIEETDEKFKETVSDTDKKKEGADS